MDISDEYVISKDFEFSASHRLDGLPVDHQCARMHGHNYAVRVELTGEVDGVGFVMDYGELDHFRTWLRASVDHRHLNDVVDFNPTAELLARWMIEELVGRIPLNSQVSLIRVGLSETPKTWAWSSWRRR
jgi:6-pyruvoyltetrahydropterin/6-carboxytetrahydropterin synthase